MKPEFKSFYGMTKQISNDLFSVEIMCGSTIDIAIDDSIRLARALDSAVQFDFNSVIVTVRADSKAQLIQRDWRRALNGYIKKNIGPHPNPVLTDEERTSDKRIEAKNERRRQKERAEYEAKAKAHRQRITAKLANAPPIELANEASWNKFKAVNTDGYGGAVVTYSERWARLMQLEMSKGKKLKDVAGDASSEADLEGITGFQYGCAVSTLSQCWKHGEQLRRWHNLKTQLGNEGEKANESSGVLNPALLVIGK